MVGSVTRPVRQLKRFEKIELKAGQSKTVRFTLDTEDFSFIGRDNKAIIEPGQFNVMVGDLTKEFTIKNICSQ